MDAKKIFITGVAGFIGSHLADGLILDGYRVAGIDNLTTGLLENIPKGVEFYECDCNNFAQLPDYLKGVDTLFHCAALPYEGLSVFSPYRISSEIFQSSASIITSAIKAGVRRFIYLSSMARYGLQKTVPFNESMVANPQNPYGIAKLAVEKLLVNLSQIHGMEYSIAVPQHIIGTRQRYDDPYRNVASNFLNRMLLGKQPILFGGGEQIRCFTAVQDAVDLLKRFINEPAVLGEVINIAADEEPISIYDLAKTCAEILDFNLNPVNLSARAQDIDVAYCSANKARELLAFKPNYSLRSCLIEMADWIKQKGPKPFDYLLEIELPSFKTPKPWLEPI